MNDIEDTSGQWRRAIIRRGTLRDSARLYRVGGLPRLDMVRGKVVAVNTPQPARDRRAGN